MTDASEAPGAERSDALAPTEPVAQAAWISNASSFPAAAFLQQQEAQAEAARAANQAALLRAAQELWESSSGSESDDDSAAAAAAAAAAPGTSTGAAGGAARHAREGDDAGRRERREGKRRGRSRSASSTSSASGSDGGRRKRHKKDKKRHKKEKHKKEKHERHHSRSRRPKDERSKIYELEQRAAALAAAQRQMYTAGRFGAQPAASGGETWYTDTRGSLENLGYETLLGSELAFYQRTDPLRLAPRKPPAPGSRAARAAEQAAAGPERYWMGRHYLRERSRRSRWLRLATLRQQQQRQRPGGGGGAAAGCVAAAPPPEVIDLAPKPAEGAGRPSGAASTEQAAAGGDEGETAEEALLRRTRELNAAVHSNPGDESLWLRLAEFQSEALPLGRGRAGASAAESAAVAEKKIAILQRALLAHPRSERIVLALLTAAREVAAPADLAHRWEVALKHHSGSALLHAAHAAQAKRSFATFHASDVRKHYADSLAALVAERCRRARAARTAASSAAAAAETLSDLEIQLVNFALEAIGFRFATGHTEAGVAAVQAVLEFHCCRPPLPPVGASVAQLFASFWRSGAPRVGEAGARGWDGWFREHVLGIVEPAVPAAPAGARSNAGGSGGGPSSALGAAAAPAAAPGAESDGDSDGGGWGGWTEWAPADAPAAPAGEDKPRREGGESSEDEEAATEEEPADIADEVLLAALGIQLDEDIARMQRAGVPAPIMARWATEEGRRSAADWLPQRATPSAGFLSAAPSAPQSEAGATSAAAAVPPPPPPPPPPEASSSGMAAGAAPGRTSTLTHQQPGVRGRKPIVIAAPSTLPAAPPPEPSSAQSPPSSSPAAAAADASEEEVDPERRVDLSDVQPFLFELESAAAQRRLALGCLELLGAPLGHWCASNVPTPAQTALLAPNEGLSIAETLRLALEVGAQPLTAPPGSSTSSGSVAGIPDSAAHSAVVSEAFARNFSCGWCAAPWYRSNSERRAFLARLLQRLVEGPLGADDRVCGAYLAVEATPDNDDGTPSASCDGTSDGEAAAPLPAPPAWDRARSAARAVLSRRQDAVVMWQAYAQLEAAAGQLRTARKVCDTTLASAAALPAVAKAALPLLALGYAEMELAAGCHDRALHIALAALAGGAGGAGSAGYRPFKAPRTWDPAELTAARLAFQAQAPALLAASGGAGTAAGAATAALAALAEWLSGVLWGAAGGGAAAASALYAQLSSAVPERQLRDSVHWESLALRGVRLLQRDAALPRTCTTPSSLRAAITSAMQQYPSSVDLLQALVAQEHRAHALSRLRRALQLAAETSPSPRAWAAAVAAELLRPGGALGVAPLFEKALATPSAVACPELWLQYMRFELSRGRGPAARRLLLRALQECVWYKGLWLFGLRRLGSFMSAKEPGDLQALMQPKGLRLRTDIYETLLEALEQQQAADV